MSKFWVWLWNALEVLSQAANAIVLGGHPNMTISARCYLQRHKPVWGVAYRLVNRLFFWQDDHCRESWVSDVVFARQALFELEVPRYSATPDVKKP